MRSTVALFVGGQLAFLATLAPCAAVAQNQPMLHVRPGQTVAEHLDAWRAPCADFVLTENENAENYLTCMLDQNQAVTANVNAEGIVWWSRFWGAGGLDRGAFVDRLRDELALEGEAEPCANYDDPAECWQVGPVEVTVPLAQQVGQWAVMVEDPGLMPRD